MSEPIEAPPKPFTATSYVFFTTFWVLLFPSLVVNTPFLLFNLFADPERIHITTSLYGAAFLLGGVVFFGYACMLLVWRFLDNHRAGQVPGSFALWVLPFWIPFFWGLAVTALCMYVDSLLPLENLPGCMAVAFPQFFLLFGFVVIGNIEYALIAFNILTFLCAVAGTRYVSRIAPPVSKWRGLILYAVITLLFCGLVGVAYNHFRLEKILVPPQDRDEVIQEGGDTDLSEYISCGKFVIISHVDNTNPNVPKLTEWFLSPQGQQLVRDVGYVPLTQ